MKLWKYVVILQLAYGGANDDREPDARAPVPSRASFMARRRMMMMARSRSRAAANPYAVECAPGLSNTVGPAGQPLADGQFRLSNF